MSADWDDNGNLRSWWPHKEPEPPDSTSRCIVHPCTPEPCPTCATLIAAGL